jgi:diaminopimelate epimerase
MRVKSGASGWTWGGRFSGAADIPTTFSQSPVIDQPLTVGGRTFPVTCVSMGNPHCVTFVDEPDDAWVLGVGPQVEVDEHFPARVNVEFVKVISRERLQQRTWERGSGETLACGTGASAVCVAGVLTGRTGRRVLIHLTGGDLEIEWDEASGHVYMTGPAEEVFTGEWPFD